MKRWIAPLLILVLCGCSQEEKPSLEVGLPKSADLTRAEKRQFEDLTVREIVQGGGLIGTSPSNLRFSADGGTIYFQWNRPGPLDSLNAVRPQSPYDNYLDLEKRAGTFAFELSTASYRSLGKAEARRTVPSSAVWDTARRRCVETRGGDIYLVDATTGQERALAITVANESSPAISPDGSTVFYVAGDNLFSTPWSGGPVTQLTDLRTADEPDEEPENDQRGFLENQQRELFADFAREDEEDDPPLKPTYLGSDLNITGLMVSPSGRYLAVELEKEASGTRAPIVPEWVTESGYVESRDTRAKVGEAQDQTGIAIVDLGTKDATWMDSDDSEWMVAMSWAPRTDQLLLRGITADWHHRFFYTLDPAGSTNDDGKLSATLIDHYEDTAWVGGPDFYNTGAWMPGGNSVYYICEREGYAHLYTVDLTGARQQLTRGPWEVHSAWFDEQRDVWWLVTNEGAPGSRRLWQMTRAGERTLVTSNLGSYQLVFDGRMRRAAALFSTVRTPDELYTIDLDQQLVAGPHTQSTTENFRSYPWIVPEVITFRASDGERIRAHLFNPRDFGAKPNGAGIVFIHGAGYLQNVTDYWSYYYREYMFNHLLAARGYTVVNVDFRASEGYGRDFRVAIHEHMGGRDVDDVADAAKYLMKEHGVGKDQVGCYGGSYGGFLTLMALFRHGDVMTSGAALRSVTDWAHYNHWYTSRILGTPTDNPEAFRKSSPIYFADGLKGNLLMLHGLEDSNVLAADIVRLSQKLIELEKENWELALHPVEGHGYQRATSWNDQLTRILRLFETTLPDGVK